MATAVLNSLPEAYVELSDRELDERILRAKARLGSRLVVLGHHYQRDEVVKFADDRGDSLKLSEIAAAHPEAAYIVFCGVHFMAESADILRAEHQVVVLPDLNAGCSMADMASLDQVEVCWEELTRAGSGKIVPVTYINSTAAIKAFVGRNDGAVCTSSNASKIMEWALGRGERGLFIPHANVGQDLGQPVGRGDGDPPGEPPGARKPGPVRDHARRLRVPVQHDVPHLTPAPVLDFRKFARRAGGEPRQRGRRNQALGARGAQPDARNQVAPQRDSPHFSWIWRTGILSVTRPKGCCPSSSLASSRPVSENGKSPTSTWACPRPWPKLWSWEARFRLTRTWPRRRRSANSSRRSCSKPSTKFRKPGAS